MYSFDKPRPRRPYEKKTVNKAGALIFGLGLGALAATLAILIGITLPYVSNRLEILPYYARTYYRKLIPHPEHLPPPAAAVTVASSGDQNSVDPLESSVLPLINEPISDEAIPAAINLTGDSLNLPAMEAESVAEDSEDTTEAVTAESGAEQVAGEDPVVEAGEVTVEETGPGFDENLLAPVQEQVQLSGVNHQWQSWNNCGPATITMNMSYFGRPEDQTHAAQFLKPNEDDKNVSPHELAAYVRTLGLGAVVRQGGSIDKLKTFLSNDVPVLAETWLTHDGDGLGHYRLLTGYDEGTHQFNSFDSLNGPNYKVDIEQFDRDWRVFNRLYIVVFPPEQREIVSAIIGEDIDDRVMYERLLAEIQAEIEANPNDPIAYFNQGEALTRLGRYQEAVIAFDQARQLGLHWRRLWYQFTPFEAYYAVGRYQDVLDLTEATLDGTGGLEEAYYYHGLALHATGQPGAVDDFQAALDYNPHFTPAAKALDTLTN